LDHLRGQAQTQQGLTFERASINLEHILALQEKRVKKFSYKDAGVDIEKGDAFV